MSDTLSGISVSSGLLKLGSPSLPNVRGLLTIPLIVTLILYSNGNFSAEEISISTFSPTEYPFITLSFSSA